MIKQTNSKSSKMLSIIGRHINTNIEILSKDNLVTVF